MLKFADNIVMLDHHISAIDDLWDLYKEPNFNMDWCTTEKSGARIAWDYVKATTKHNRKIPQFLLHVEDYDLYKLQLPGSKAIAKANYSGELSLERCDRLMGMSKSGLKGFQKKGEILLEALENDIKRIADSCSRLLDIGGFRVPAANANAIFSTELGNYLSKGQPFAATYYDIKKYRIYSLRSQPDGMDVSKIAKMYDGGGHPRAAGFRVARSHPLARV
jgi:oligoribonuclease NrnB/cAMP/cGMP phosphodiesterase (DHH superfamily)